jgi:BMFP domain-containing protein YqiC
MPAEVNGLATLALVGRHEFDAAVEVSVVVPIHK